MGLPDADRAEVELRKLRDSCLSPIHPVSRYTAVVSRAALGLTANDAHILRDWLMEAAVDGQAVIEKSDEFGDRYHLDFEIASQFGAALVRSAWVIRTGEDFPRLTTCYVLPK